eukprot:GHRQ01027603.1.p2 GENE.GHRQ01027603.1~~GHRQ01027603.1.p2  ORF type:complete len:206 (+),score=63.03 GHRQ01027603.1:79-696(+)
MTMTAGRWMHAASSPFEVAAMQGTELPLHSRLFIVCGRSVEEDVLKQAFLPFGNLENIKLIKEKGVCFVKYDKASSAALAMESLNGAVLNNGKGPKLKVLLAEAPTPRGVQQQQGVAKLMPQPEQEVPSDPDNVPPRSRLFLVVPKTADGQLIHVRSWWPAAADVLRSVLQCRSRPRSSSMSAAPQLGRTECGWQSSCFSSTQRS